MRQIGRGREFEKLREYVPGDGSDEIHWKATARRGRPITKVFQVERTQEIYVVIDASRLSARPAGDETALERSIAAALIVGAAAERRGDLFGLAAFSHQVEAFTRARNGKSHYAACRDAIYQIAAAAHFAGLRRNLHVPAPSPAPARDAAVLDLARRSGAG